MIALLAPGQGAQKPGMLSPWLELPGVAEQAAPLSKAAGLDLVALGTTADADAIKDTAITQPLVVAMALLTASVIDEQIGLPARAPVAGHSVGELAAASLAGVMDATTAVRLAARRGSAMAACCGAVPTSMAAVLGGDKNSVIAELAERGLVAANVNGGGQIVAAGTIDALAALQENPPTGASRVIPLPVAGAFHTQYMAAATDELATAVNAVTPADPSRQLLTNADGTVIDSGSSYLSHLVGQLTRPVRWDLCMRQLQSMGVTAVIEFAPGGTLTGLVKRELGKAVATVAVKAPADLDKVRALIQDHAAAAADAAGSQ